MSPCTWAAESTTYTRVHAEALGGFLVLSAWCSFLQLGSRIPFEYSLELVSLDTSTVSLLLHSFFSSQNCHSIYVHSDKGAQAALGRESKMDRGEGRCTRTFPLNLIFFNFYFFAKNVKSMIH